MSWTVIVHAASEDLATTPYNEATVTDVAALGAYVAYPWVVLAIDEQVNMEESSLEYADGSMQQSRTLRFSYDVEIVPVSYASDRDKFTTQLAYILQAKHLWLELNTLSQDGTYNVGTTDQYHATDKCIPVSIDSISPGHDHNSGSKTLKISFKRKFRPI